ncbi:ceramidase domain-containing protein [Sorangium sp. So ce327]|uniref:ceramidase domain-containing protein n=1 Tax=Sorangium sp. So ce327 TaxID=3133301 RepID=UPI003F645C70
MSSSISTVDPQGCPWQGLAEHGLPNVKWCEERMCAWINEPANAWSNLAYLVVACWIWLLQRSHGTAGKSALRWFAPTLAIVGMCSFVYHASNVYVTQILDFLGMYLFCLLLLLLNLLRLGALPLSRFSVVFVGCVTAFTALTAVVARYEVPIQGFILLLTLAIVGTELFIYRRSRDASAYSLNAFALSLALLLVAAAFSALDVSRAWCNPKSHVLQGHAVWHVLSALSLGVVFYHYRQFDGETQGAGAGSAVLSGT